MTRIIVVPETLRSLSSQLQRAAQEINAISGRVSGALGGLDWEARQKAGVDGQANDARGRASALASQAETMARYLTGKAQAFEEADRQGVESVVDLGAQLSATQQQWLNSPYAPVWNFPQGLVDAQMRLGQVDPSNSRLTLITPVPTPSPTASQSKAVSFAVLLPALAVIADNASSFKDVILSGRTPVRDTFKYVGRTINVVSGSRGAVTQMEGIYNVVKPVIPDARQFKLPSGLAGSALIDFPLEYMAHPEDYGLHGAGVAATKIGIDYVIAATPVGAAVLWANSAVKFGGSVTIWGVSETAKWISTDPMMDQLVADQADKTRKALEKLDINKTTRNLATLLVDSELAKWQARVKTAKDLWQEPSVTNVAKLGLLVTPGTDTLGLMIADPEAYHKQTQNTLKVGSSVWDFGVGVFQVPFELNDLMATAAVATKKGVYDRVITASKQAAAMYLPAALLSL